MAVNVVLAGSLKFINLGELIQLLGSNGSTGILRVFTRLAPDPGYIYFVEGNPIDAVSGKNQGMDALFALFGWLEADFEFTEETVERSRTVRKSRMEIILDSLSMLDDGLIPKLGEQPVKSDPKNSLPPSDLPLIKGPMVDYIFVLDEEDYQDGSLIVEEGKHGRWIWVILEGIVEIAKTTPKGPLPILRIGEGAFVGGASTFQLGGGMRSASTNAVGRVQLGVIDAQRLTNEFSSFSKPMSELTLGLERRLKQVTDTVVDIELGKNNIKARIEGKKPVMKQGSTDERLFQIKAGQACIIQQTAAGYIFLAQLEPGDLFGKVSFFDMGHEPYSATVLGSEDLEIVPVDTDRLKEEFDQLSPTFRNMIENLATCLLATTQVAAKRLKKKKVKRKGKKSA